MGFILRNRLAIITLFLLAGGHFFAWASDEPYASKYEKNPAYNDCLAKFDMSEVNLNDPEVRQDLGFLTEYFHCKAAADNNIGVCDSIVSTEDSDMCRKHFKQYVVFLGYALNNGLTKEGMRECYGALNDKAKCEDFLQGLKQNDSSMCDQATGAERDECRAQIDGRINLCPSFRCQDKATFVNAVRLKNINLCQGIKDPMVNSVCRGYVGKKKACEDNRGFRAFREKYCINKVKRESIKIGARNEKED